MTPAALAAPASATRPQRGHGKAVALARMGLWAAVTVTLTSTAFSVTAILGFTGVLGFPWDPVLPDVASLVLAVAFLVMMVSLHHTLDEQVQAWSHLGVLFGLMYAVLVGIVYFVITTVVVPYTDRGQAGRVAVLEFDEGGSLMQALDGLGYFFLSLATFSAAFAFAGRADRWLRRIFVVNGVLGVPILLSYMPLVVGWSEYVVPIAALWMVSVPACGVVVALRFRNSLHQGSEPDE